MATRNQQSHPSGQVVSVRLPPDVIKRIDALTGHTGRSRGLYIRLALSAFLPQLEEDHWNQKAASYERAGFDCDFAQITTHLMGGPEPSPWASTALFAGGSFSVLRSSPKLGASKG